MRTRFRVRQQLLAIIRAAKNRPCADCKVQFKRWVMTFDHRDRRKKRGNISQMAREPGMTVEKLQAEIAKCDVVCANCHSDREYRRGVLKVA